MKTKNMFAVGVAVALSGAAYGQMSTAGVGDKQTDDIRTPAPFVASITDPTLATFGPTQHRRPIVVLGEAAAVLSTSVELTTHGAQPVRGTLIVIDREILLAELAAAGVPTTHSPGPIDDAIVIVDLRHAELGPVSGPDQAAPSPVQGRIVVIEDVLALLGGVSGPVSHGASPVRDPFVIIDKLDGVIVGNLSGPLRHGFDDVRGAMIVTEEVAAALGGSPTLDTHGAAPVEGSLIDFGDEVDAALGDSPVLVRRNANRVGDRLFVAREVDATLGDSPQLGTHAPADVVEKLTAGDQVDAALGGPPVLDTQGGIPVEDPFVIIDYVDLQARPETSPTTMAPGGVPTAPASSSNLVRPPTVPASFSVLAGSGANPIVFRETSPAVLGATWTGRVDLSGHAAATGTVFAMSAAALPRPLTADAFVGELLIDPSAFLTFETGAGMHAVPVPPTPSLVGSRVYMQAALRFNGIAGPVLLMANGLQVTVGNF